MIENRERVALERGPMVFCVEGIDNQGSVAHITLPDEVLLEAEHDSNLLHGITTIHDQESTFVAIPYYAWSHRGTGEMAVWLPRR